MTGLEGVSASGIAGWARQAAGIGHSPPVSVPFVAGALGVRVRRSRSLTADATLDRAGGLPVVTLRAEPRHEGEQEPLSGRQAFSLAHELGHHLLDDNLGMPYERQVDDPDVERWCDRFASCLLLPPIWVKQIFRDVQPNLSSAFAAAALTGASLAASLVALDRHAGWNAALLGWRHERGRWRLLTITAPAGARTRLGSGPGTSPALDALAVSRTPARAVLPMRVDGTERSVIADTLRRRRVTALVELGQLD